MKIPRLIQISVLLSFTCLAVMPLGAQGAQDPRPAIHQAVASNKIDKVQAAIDGGADVNALWEKESPLCAAIAAGRQEIAKLIIHSPRVDVNKRATHVDGFGDEWERTALIIAARRGDTEIVDLLLKKGADINARDRVNGSPLSKGFSALMMAAGKDHLDTVQLLLAQARKPDVLMRDKNGMTAFWFAVENENLEMVKLLYSHGSKINLPDNSGASVLTATFMHKKYDVLDFLIAKGADVNLSNHGGATTLMMAVNRASANTPAGLAYLAMFLTFKPKLDFERIGDNDGGYSALHLAARIGFVEVAKLLLDNGANINIVSLATGGTPLHTAAGTKNIDMAKYLIERGAKKEIQDKMGFTPLMHAVVSANPKMVQAFVEGGAATETKSSSHNLTPLVMAAANPDPTKHRDYIKIIKILLDGKADINFPASDGRTALMAAAGSADSSQALDKAELLLDRGAKPDAVKNGGETALMLAAGRGHEKVVELLLDKGANIQIKNGAGESAMSYAKRSGSNAIVALLESKGLKADTPLVVKNVPVKELIGIWQGSQDGLPQAIMKLTLNKDRSFDFVSRLTPEILKQYPKGSVKPVIAAQKGTYAVNNDVLILNLIGAAPVSRKWKIENKVLILDNIIRLKKIK